MRLGCPAKFLEDSTTEGDTLQTMPLYKLPNLWEEEEFEEFDCIYCFKHEVIGEPISNLICPQCLMRATMLGRWESFWFDVEHGPLVL